MKLSFIIQQVAAPTEAGCSSSLVCILLRVLMVARWSSRTPARGGEGEEKGRRRGGEGADADDN